MIGFSYEGFRAEGLYCIIGWNQTEGSFNLALFAVDGGDLDHGSGYFVLCWVMIMIVVFGLLEGESLGVHECFILQFFFEFSDLSGSAFQG